MARARTQSILIALVALATPSVADTECRSLPSTPCPALSAAPLVYVFVESPLGCRTWAEQEMERIRLGITTEVHEDGNPAASYVLLALHTPRTVSSYALEMMEAPPDTPKPAAAGISTEPAIAFEDRRLVSAFEAMGLTPEDLVEPAELPGLALVFADAVANLSNMIFRGPREADPRSEALVVEPAKRYERPTRVRFQKPAKPDELPAPNLRLYAKQITRSIYKILLGVAIGVLIWGFVRNTA